MMHLHQKYSMRRLNCMQKMLLIGLLFIVVACKKTPPPASDQGYDYYPLDSGITSIYRIDSISYNDNSGKIDTFHFFLMERMAGLVTDLTFKEHRIIERYVRKNDSTEWEQRASFYVLRTDYNLQKVEENNRIVKLLFPVGNTLSWNGNMFNSQGRQTFYLLLKGNTYKSPDTTFANTVFIQEARSEPGNPVEEVLVTSVYASNIGLVHHTNTYINTQVTGRSGYKVFQNLISYSKP
ncbi:MAG: hypothetical protein H7296_09045 [Bacteroidia bacterium]|nr:hypothetical protein [Bacteroidia bacterium]